jgi:metal-responsive CopG/Arc/MetJ family transcriptional regulator
MASSIPATKKRGRPATGKGDPVQVRLKPELMTALDAWIDRQPERKPSRPEAIRQLLAECLKRAT